MHQAAVIKDDENEGPIPLVWREVFTRIVDAFVRGDYQLSMGVAGVAPVSERTAEDIRESIEDYGEELVALTEETWESSVCIWVHDHWDALIDLRTDSEGTSDLVLQARVTEVQQGYRTEIHMVYVP